MSRFHFIAREKAHFRVNLLCRMLKVSRSGFYAWSSRPPSARMIADEVLTEQIRSFHTASRFTYGAPRINDDLRDAGVYVGTNEWPASSVMPDSRVFTGAAGGMPPNRIPTLRPLRTF